MSATTTTACTVLQDGEPTYGILRYVAAGHTPKPSVHNFHLPELSEFSDVHRVPLHELSPLPTIDGISSAELHAQLFTCGCSAIRHPSTMHHPPYDSLSFRDPELLRRLYFPEVEDMLKRMTGAGTVVTEGCVLRTSTWTELDALAKHGGHGIANERESLDETPQSTALSELETGFPQFIGFNTSEGGVSPAPKIHLDYSPQRARTHIREFHVSLTATAADIIAAEDNLIASGNALHDSYVGSVGPRWALFSIWRPLKPVRRDPLALGDARTFANKDYVPVAYSAASLGRPGVIHTHEAQAYLARYREGQRWCWVKEQKPEDVLTICLFDSSQEKEGTLASGGTLHSSVELDGPGDEEPRESLEVRCLAI